MTVVADAKPSFKGRVTLPHVFRSEWTKLLSLRSTRWTMLIAVLLTIGIPLIVAAVTAHRWDHLDPDERTRNHALDIALSGVELSQLAIGILAVLVITGEYSTGMIRASLTAVPKRLPVLWAKLGVFALAAGLLMIPSVLISFFASQALMNSHPEITVSFSDGGVARTVLGGALYLMLLGVLILSLGAILRNTAAGIGAFVAIFFVIPPLLNNLVLPTNWRDAIAKFFPGDSGQSIFSFTHGTHDLGPGAGLLVFSGYCVLFAGIAAMLLVRRDA